MKRKELEALNNELIAKVEKQRLLIEKLQEDLKIEKGLTKTVFVEKHVDNKLSIMPMADTVLLSHCIGDLKIFKHKNNERPMDLISFEDWLIDLKRKDLIGNAKYFSEEMYETLDEMDLASIKRYFRTPLKAYYEKQKEEYLDFLNKTLVRAFKKKEKGE